MSKTGRTNYRRGSRGTPKPDRQIMVRGVRREQPDLRKLSRAVIAMALRDAEAEAEIDNALAGTEPAAIPSPAAPTSLDEPSEDAND